MSSFPTVYGQQTQEQGVTSFPSIAPVMDEYQQQSRVSSSQIFTGGALPGNTVITLGQNVVQIDGGSQRILVGDGTNNRLLLGSDDSGNLKMKLSQAGHDVLTASDNQLIWSSDFNSFKIVARGTGTVSGSNNSAGALWTLSHTTSIAHGVTGGVFPIHQVFFTQAAGNFRRMAPSSYDFQGALAFPWQTYIIADTDATNLNVRFYTCPGADSSAETVSFTYYILVETAS